MTLNAVQLVRNLAPIVESFALTGGSTYTLPTTGVKAGQQVLVSNSGAFDLVINASGGTALTLANGANLDATIQVGTCLLMALQDTPTLVTHWLVLNVYEEGSHVTTWTFGGGGTGTSGSTTLRYVRYNKLVSITIPTPAAQATVASSPTVFSNDTVLPAKLRPTRTDIFVGACCAKTAGTGDNPAQLNLTSAGVFRLFRTMAGSAQTFSGSSGFGDQVNAFEHFSWNQL